MGGDISAAQRVALAALAPIVGSDFYLGGGVAVALRLHHRSSHDLDLFSAERDPNDLEEALVQSPSLAITARAPGTLHLDVGGVPVSLLRYRYALLHPTETDANVPLRVASADDLIGMKLSAIGGRGARRDFWDLHELLVASGRSLGEALELFSRKYPQIDRGHIVRALAYFADADAEPMPRELTTDKWQAIKNDFAQWTRANRP